MNVCTGFFKHAVWSFRGLRRESLQLHRCVLKLDSMEDNQILNGTVSTSGKKGKTKG